MPNPKTPATGAKYKALRKRNRQREDTIIEAVREGLSYPTAAKLAGVTYETVRIWRRADPELSARFDEAAAQGAFDKMHGLHKLCESTDEKVRLKAIMYWLSRRTEEFRDKVEANVTIEDKRQVLVVPQRAETAEEWLAETSAKRMGEN